MRAAMPFAKGTELSRSPWESDVSLSRETDRTSVRNLRTVVRNAEPSARLASFLRRRHPFKTAMAVEAESGVSAAATEKLMQRGSMPGFANLGRLLAAYGPELLTETMDNPPSWLCEAARLQALARGD